jgi:hypothetical protein
MTVQTKELVLLVFGIAGCAGNGATPVQKDSSGEAAECEYSSAVDVASDGGLTPGCHVVPDAQVCQVSNGATVSPDGAVTNGTKSCKPLCAVGQYPVSCLGENVMSPVPQLPPGLSCHASGLPTSSNEMSYCCQCEN